MADKDGQDDKAAKINELRAHAQTFMQCAIALALRALIGGGTDGGELPILDRDFGHDRVLLVERVNLSVRQFQIARSGAGVLSQRGHRERNEGERQYDEYSFHIESCVSPPCKGGVAAPLKKWSLSEKARTGW